MSGDSPRIGWPTFHHAALAPRTAPFGTVAAPLPIIVDSDPGLDDALALALAVARPELNLLAVTSVGGNADVNHCTENALRLMHLYGAGNVPVAEGAVGPLTGPLERATEVHGESGLGNTKLPVASRKAESEGAVALMARLIAIEAARGFSQSGERRGRFLDGAPDRRFPRSCCARAHWPTYEHRTPDSQLSAPGAKDCAHLPHGRVGW